MDGPRERPYVVWPSVVLDVGGEVIRYLAGWANTNATAAVSRFAETIDRISKP